MIYIGLARYTEKDIEQIISIKPEGVILGDILCNKRMFPFAGNELVAYMSRLTDKGIKVLFQTPMYMTDRIYENIIQTIEYYNYEKMINGVIVQDIGVANKLKKSCPKLEIIWGRMGYARTPIINKSTIAYYINNGISGFECKNIDNLSVANEFGVMPYLVYGWPVYSTINRECYYKFENNIFDDSCALGCLKKERMILGHNLDEAITIDGYVLGFKADYNEDNIKNYTSDINMVIYGENLTEVRKRLGKLEVMCR